MMSMFFYGAVIGYSGNAIENAVLHPEVHKLIKIVTVSIILLQG
jgi:hypothetical protein